MLASPAAPGGCPRPGRPKASAFPTSPARHPLLLGREALRDPATARCVRQSPRTRHAGGVRARNEPGAASCWQSRRGSCRQGDHVLPSPPRSAARPRTVAARLAAGDADLDRLALREQAHRLRRRQAAPVEVRHDGCAHGVRCSRRHARRRGSCRRPPARAAARRPRPCRPASGRGRCCSGWSGADLHGRDAQSVIGEPAHHLRDDLALHRAVEEGHSCSSGQRDPSRCSSGHWLTGSRSPDPARGRPA